MFSWSIIFFIMACISAIFGFSGIGHTASVLARCLLALFVVLFIATLVFGRRFEVDV